MLKLPAVACGFKNPVPEPVPDLGEKPVQSGSQEPEPEVQQRSGRFCSAEAVQLGFSTPGPEIELDLFWAGAVCPERKSWPPPHRAGSGGTFHFLPTWFYCPTEPAV